MSATRQQVCEMSDDGRVPSAVDERRDRVADLIGDQSLSARSVLATALLGADQPHLTVGELVAMASLFGISDGAARTCLWRMVANGELTSDDGTYALAGGLLERRQRVDEASRIAATRAMGWHVGVGGRLAGTPIGGRSACAAQGRNSTAPRRTTGRRVVSSGQPRPGPLADAARRAGSAVCSLPRRRNRHSRGTVRSLFSLDDWAADARRLTLAMRDELDAEAVPADDFAYQFALSITVVRHLQLDPLLPAELIPRQWPGQVLRSTYRRFNEVFKQRLNTAFR